MSNLSRDRVAVLLPLPLAEAYDYAVPEGLDPVDGDYVAVPLGSRQVVGVVWGDAGHAVPEEKLRPLLHGFDLPPLPAAARRFVDWMAGYVVSPPGAVLRMTLNPAAALEPPAPTVAYLAAATVGGAEESMGRRLTAARRRVLETLAGGPPRPVAELARDAACGVGVVRAMAAAGLLTAVDLPPVSAFPHPDLTRPRARLNDSQQRAAERLAAAVSAGGYSATLLEGVTGSGKTEVYFEALAAALAAGRQALVLVPEIALTAPWLDRFAERFGVLPAQWHSDLTPRRRRETWRGVALGEARVLVGARSALFLPFADLGLIVVDEEHDAAFKQEDGVVYHARDMAVARAHLGGIPVVLASATPSLETAVNAETGRYARLDLPQRHGGAVLPSIEAVDLRQASPPRGRFLSPILVEALTETLAAGEQSLLYLNRRGYAPLTLCRACGHRLDCPNCTAWLVEHRLAGRLLCHHCGHAAARPARCPACGAEDSFTACGPGVERVAEEVAGLFPEARVALMTSDLVHGPAQAQALLRQVIRHEVDLLIGTQLVAKGHHFPMLTLVGVVDADLGLNGGDLRAGERTYQLLSQVAGRAGRADRPGRVLLQSWQPDHPVIEALAAGDRDAFLARETAWRQRGGWPPYTRLAALIVAGADRAQVDRTAQALGRTAPCGGGIEVFGPAEAPLAVLRGRHRRRLLVKASRKAPLQATIARWLAATPIPNAVRVTVDIDPYSFV